MFNRRKSVVSGIPNAAAIAAAISYYDGLYQDTTPDPAKFFALVSNHGLPDWPNPFLPGEEGYYRIHPDGFLLADIEAIVEDLVIDRLHHGNPSELPPADAGAWPDPRVSASINIEQASISRSIYAKIARHCWAIALSSGTTPSRLLGIVHPDNLWLVNMEVLALALDGAWPDIDPAKVSAGIQSIAVQQSTIRPPPQADPQN
jgi:hypothetical protein